MKLFAVLVMLFVLAVPVVAADIDGKWSGSVVTAGGEIPVTFTFKADGEKLTGTTMNFDGSEIKISDGKIDAAGKNITFKLTLDLGGMPFVLNYKGVVSAAEIKMASEGEGIPMPIEFVLKKDPAAK
jgi:hypothetical protein